MSDTPASPPDKPRIGRPSLRTEETVAKIVASVELGCSDRTAAELANVSPVTLRKWMVADPAFRARINEARSKRKQLLIAYMIAGVVGQDAGWNTARLNTALALLRAHEPEVWTPKAQVEHTGAIGIFQAAAATLRDKDMLELDDGGDEEPELIEAPPA